VEGCTGWRFVIEECQAAGVVGHLAEPADVAGLQGRRRHAKTESTRRAELVGFARHQPGYRALQAEYGIGALTAVVVWSEMGDARRFAHSRDAVRHAGLDITVYSSDSKRSPGRLSRQGSPLLRWALFEAGRCAGRASSPDHAYYAQVAARLGGQRATLSVARKLAHRLRALGEQALAPPA
jgi:transposase